jgi:hypothetical protein
MAGAVLVQHKSKFLEFLEFVRDKKDNRKFTNMEKNLYNALQDLPTLTELSVLALYAQAISHPYISEIRGSDLNMLNLGPLHAKIKEHIEKLITNPGLLLNPSSESTPGTFDDRPYENPEAVKAILDLAPKLPHLADVLVAFLKGASSTWDRFTSEFVPGGIIDEATDLEKDLAWMPATNNLNEGALGSYRVFMRYKPRTALHNFNAQAMYRRNNTQEFMEKEFTEEDHKFVMRKAREIDKSGLEKKRRAEFMIHAEKRVKEKRVRQKAREKRISKRNARIAQVMPNFFKEKVKDIKGEALKDQVAYFRLAGAELPKASELGLAEAKRDALRAAIDQYVAGTWIPKVLVFDVDSSGEEENAGSESDE